MRTATKVCKVCGCEYEYCYTQLKDDNIFRWQDVACCKEHGAEYFKMVMISRGELSDKKSKVQHTAKNKTTRMPKRSQEE